MFRVEPEQIVLIHLTTSVYDQNDNKYLCTRAHNRWAIISEMLIRAFSSAAAINQILLKL